MENGSLILFDLYRLVDNHYNRRKIIVSKGGDKAFAVVYVDTLRQMILDGKDFHWHGRARKI